MNDNIVQVRFFKSSIKGQIHGIFQLEQILAPEDIRQHKKFEYFCNCVLCDSPF
jgi:hypothetical protein